MLGVKKTKFIQTLIDMLELDTSDHVRTMVIIKKCKDCKIEVFLMRMFVL